MDVTREELEQRLADDPPALLDVRTSAEYTGQAGAPCDPRQGHIPGARNIELGAVVGLSPEALRELVGLPEGAEVVVYCHSGGRSALAASVLAAAGYRARNYPGSWHEWSRDPSLPLES